MRPIPGLPIEQQDALVLSRMLVYGEARGEPALGRVAVLAVAYNRSKYRNKPLAKIILAPWQFSTFNENDPNREKLLEAWKTDPSSWSSADTICELWEALQLQDPTDGSDHYHTKDIHPTWAQDPRMVKKAEIGHHIFYRWEP